MTIYLFRFILLFFLLSLLLLLLLLSLCFFVYRLLDDRRYKKHNTVISYYIRPSSLLNFDIIIINRLNNKFINLVATNLNYFIINI